KGPVIFQNEELDDLILARGDGMPTYHLAVVVDDITMEITHVIRGDDHVNNTPKQIQIYQALGQPLPQYAHVPMILGPDKTKLSKRHGAVSVLAYREMGILPEALINTLVRLGWAHGDEEIFSREEMIAKFSLDQVGKSAGIFNSEKLLWLNSHYLKEASNEKLSGLVAPFIGGRGYPADDFLLFGPGGGDAEGSQQNPGGDGRGGRLLFSGGIELSAGGGSEIFYQGNADHPGAADSKGNGPAGLGSFRPGVGFPGAGRKNRVENEADRPADPSGPDRQDGQSGALRGNGGPGEGRDGGTRPKGHQIYSGNIASYKNLAFFIKMT
ncbi:MAG: hypothetical protein EHM75_07570, partial [Desulfobacteraceae bacterium]